MSSWRVRATYVPPPNSSASLLLGQQPLASVTLRRTCVIGVRAQVVDMTAGNALASMMDDVGSTQFTGYGGLQAQGRIVALLRNGKSVDEAEEGWCSEISPASVCPIMAELDTEQRRGMHQSKTLSTTVISRATCFCTCSRVRNLCKRRTVRAQQSGRHPEPSPRWSASIQTTKADAATFGTAPQATRWTWSWTRRPSTPSPAARSATGACSPPSRTAAKTALPAPWRQLQWFMTCSARRAGRCSCTPSRCRAGACTSASRRELDSCMVSCTKWPV